MCLNSFLRSSLIPLSNSNVPILIIFRVQTYAVVRSSYLFFSSSISLWGISCYQTLHSLCYCLHFIGLQSRVLTQTFLGLIFFFFFLEGSIVEGLLNLKPLPTFLYAVSVIHSTLLKVSNIGMYLIGGILLETYHE